MFKCKFCRFCNGEACKGELPGMGGVFNNENFIANCNDWDTLFNEFSTPVQKEITNITITQDDIGLAPVTGAVENIGFNNESDFYPLYIGGGLKIGLTTCVGDGYPDEKLKLGVKAVKDFCFINKTSEPKNKKIADVAYFLKPYPKEKLLNRCDYLYNATIIGCDIDAYNIITMRNKVHLSKLTAADLKDLHEYTKLPLAIKGIFTNEDIELCKEVAPDIIVISNHGGRVETRHESSARFLQKYGGILKRYCNDLWVDGGIRKKRDIQVAKYLGAKKVLIGRPFVTAICKNGASGVELLLKVLTK